MCDSLSNYAYFGNAYFHLFGLQCNNSTAVELNNLNQKDIICLLALHCLPIYCVYTDFEIYRQSPVKSPDIKALK